MDEEVKLLDIQLSATYLYIISLVISILITYNDKLNLLNKKQFFNEKQEYNISVFNRIFVIALSLIFLYINVKNKKLDENNGKNSTPFKLQIAASELSVVAALIVTYVVVTSGEYSIISSVENPSL